MTRVYSSHLSEKNTGAFWRRPISRWFKNISFWPSIVRATRYFLPFWVFQWIQNILTYKDILILHHPGLLVTRFEEKLVYFLKTINFSSVQTIWFCPTIGHAIRYFLTVLDLPLHQWNNKVHKCTNFKWRANIHHTSRRKTLELFEDHLFLDGFKILVFGPP
jgi:hypothetical protein